MPLRITPMRPIERGGLKGFGFSVFIDNSPEGQRAAESPRFESVLGAREAHRPATYGQLVTAGETAPHPHSSAFSSRRDEKTGEDGTPPTSSPVTPTGEA